MNIDQRLEALTQSVELLAPMQRDNEARFDARFAKILDAIERLTQVAESHEHRIGNLENRKQ